MLDGMAQRYGCLPSSVLAQGDIFDLYVFETVRSFEQYQQDRELLEQGQVTPGNSQILQSMMEKVKGVSDANKKSQ